MIWEPKSGRDRVVVGAETGYSEKLERLQNGTRQHELKVLIVDQILHFCTVKLSSFIARLFSIT